MPNASPTRTPSYRRHKPTNQGVVTLNGHDYYLGRYGSKESKAEYDRLIAEWLAGGRRLPDPSGKDLSIGELILAYWTHASAYYGFQDGRTGTESCLRDALRVVRELYGRTRALDFGPLALKACRQRMIGKCWSRNYVNHQVGRIRRMFRWAAEEELLPGHVHQDLQTVAGLRRGKTDARETAGVKPVPTERMEATLPFLPPVVQAMVRLQVLTGCRPAEACAVRPMDLDMRNPACWVYRPGSDAGPHGEHKTAHHGHDRLILIGPRAQEVLRPWLGTKLDAYCFSPAQSEVCRHERQRRERKTPLTRSQRARRAKRSRRRAPQDHYNVTSYRNAVYRACDRAFPLPGHLGPRQLPNGKRESRRAWWARLTPQEKDEVRAWRRQHRWHPNRLRHSRATELRSYGLDVVKTILGHSKVETSQVYAEKDLAAAMELVAKIG
jgi:integrase